MESAQAKTDYRMMKGSSHNMDYCCIARRGTIGLGIKVVGIERGKKMNMPDHVYLQVRVRSADVGDLFEDMDGPQQVVSLMEHKLSFREAWPSISFDKEDSSRASTVVGIFIPGDWTDEKAMDTVLEVKDGIYVDNMAKFLFDSVGPDNAVLSKDEIAQYIHNQLKTGLHNISAHFSQKVGVSKAMAEMNVVPGVAGFHAAQMKSIYEKVMKEQQEAAHDDSPEDEEYAGEEDQPED